MLYALRLPADPFGGGENTGRRLYRAQPNGRGPLRGWARGAYGGACGGARAPLQRHVEEATLQHILTAVGMNVVRLIAWWKHRPRAATRRFPFAALTPA
jgi:hypothetical protein